MAKPMSMLRGKREVERFNGHDVVVIVPDKDVSSEKASDNLRKLLKELV